MWNIPILSWKTEPCWSASFRVGLFSRHCLRHALPYQGDTTCPEIIREGYTFEPSILSLCETLTKCHHIFFDRYFITVKLADILLQKGFYATSTIPKKKTRILHL